MVKQIERTHNARPATKNVVCPKLPLTSIGAVKAFNKTTAAVGIVINELRKEKRDLLFKVKKRASKSTINKKGALKIVVVTGFRL